MGSQTLEGGMWRQCVRIWLGGATTGTVPPVLSPGRTYRTNYRTTPDVSDVLPDDASDVSDVFRTFRTKIGRLSVLPRLLRLTTSADASDVFRTYSGRIGRIGRKRRGSTLSRLKPGRTFRTTIGRSSDVFRRSGRSGRFVPDVFPDDTSDVPDDASDDIGRSGRSDDQGSGGFLFRRYKLRN